MKTSFPILASYSVILEPTSLTIIDISTFFFSLPLPSLLHALISLAFINFHILATLNVLQQYSKVTRIMSCENCEHIYVSLINNSSVTPSYLLLLLKTIASIKMKLFPFIFALFFFENLLTGRAKKGGENEEKLFQ